MTRPISNVCVVGAGFLGTQIATQCAAFGKTVSIHDVRAEAFSTSEASSTDWTQQMIHAGELPADQQPAVLGRIHRTTSLAEAVTDAAIVIEAVKEDVDVKREVFAQLDKLCPADTVLATNSSSIRISRIESATDRLDRVLNTHFVHPVWKHPFVELMRGTATSDETMDTVESFMTSIGILSVFVQKESTGFLFNRIWRAVKKEALRVVDQGISTPEDVDRTWMIQWETPMGPFALMDSIGLDVIRDIELVYYGESGDPTDAPPRVLLDLIERGDLGVKTGRGFYQYPNPAWDAPDFLKQGAAE